jgi:hypothetical protein
MPKSALTKDAYFQFAVEHGLTTKDIRDFSTYNIIKSLRSELLVIFQNELKKQRQQDKIVQQKKQITTTAVCNLAPTSSNSLDIYEFPPRKRQEIKPVAMKSSNVKHNSTTSIGKTINIPLSSDVNKHKFEKIDLTLGKSMIDTTNSVPTHGAIICANFTTAGNCQFGDKCAYRHVPLKEKTFNNK